MTVYPVSTPGFSLTRFSGASQNTKSEKAEGSHEHPNIGVQPYLPVGQKRDLTPEEEVRINKNLDNWLPTLFPGYGTPAEEMLAHPVKTGVLTGAVSGGLLGTLAGLFQAMVATDFSGTTALIAGGVAAVTGLFGGITTAISRSVQNNNIIDLMRRSPKGATRRDLLSDPVYQRDLMVSRGPVVTANGLGDTLLSAGLIAALLGERDQ